MYDIARRFNGLTWGIAADQRVDAVLERPSFGRATFGRGYATVGREAA